MDSSVGLCPGARRLPRPASPRVVRSAGRSPRWLPLLQREPNGPRGTFGCQRGGQQRSEGAGRCTPSESALPGGEVADTVRQRSGERRPDALAGASGMRQKRTLPAQPRQPACRPGEALITGTSLGA